MSCLCEKNIPDGIAVSPKCVKDIWLFSEFEFDGESIFGQATHYPVTAWCMEATYTCGFKKSDFEQLILEHPSIGLKQPIRKKMNVL